MTSIKKFNPDIILLNGSKTLKYGALSKKLLSGNFKLVYRVIDSPVFWNTALLTKFYYKRIIVPLIDAAVGVSHASLKDMKELYSFSKPSTVIHRAVNFSAFANIDTKEKCRIDIGLSLEKKVLIFIGNLTSQKRPDRLIEIVKGIHSNYQNIHTLVLGDGPLREEIEIIINQAGLQSLFSFVGYQQNVATFIAASDILLLTSDTEGLPGIVPEAAFFNVPAIASNVGGIAECIDEGKTGFIVEKNNIEKFVEKSLYLLQNNEIRNAMGQNANKLALKDFDLNNIAESYLTFFKNL
jgi:glycosyltransferase involved in cell wall biosynthesis